MANKDYLKENLDGTWDTDPTEVESWADFDEEQDATELPFLPSNDPYFVRPKRSSDKPHYNFYFDDEGHIRTKNLSAYWIPEVSITEEIGGTIYTVTGSYDGDSDFVRKLERIATKNMTGKRGESRVNRNLKCPKI